MDPPEKPSAIPIVGPKQPTSQKPQNGETQTEAEKSDQETEFESQMRSLRESTENIKLTSQEEVDIEVVRLLKNHITEQMTLLENYTWKQGADKLASQGILVDLIKGFPHLSDAKLNHVLTNVNLLRLFHHLVNVSGFTFRTQALQSLLSLKLHRLSLESLTTLIYLFCWMFGKNAPPEVLHWYVRVFTSVHGHQLTLLKNKVDYHGRSHNVFKLIYKYIYDEAQRNRLLEHFKKEAEDVEWKFIHSERTQRPIKILSDIDDTIISSGGSIGGADTRYSWGTVYPGVKSFFQELDLGANRDTLSEESSVVCISARPDIVEEKTYERFLTTDLHTRCILLTGTLRDGLKTAWGNYDSTAETKYLNFIRISAIYPEYKFVFIGDSGQGDYIAAKKMCAAFPNMALEAFIHNVYPLDKMAGYLEADFKSPNPNIHFFATYIGAALEAHNAGLISRKGVLRVIEGTKSDFEKFQKETMAQTMTQSQTTSWNPLANRGAPSTKVSAAMESLMLRKKEQNDDIARVAEAFSINIQPIP